MMSVLSVETLLESHLRRREEEEEEVSNSGDDDDDNRFCFSVKRELQRRRRLKMVGETDRRRAISKTNQ